MVDTTVAITIGQNSAFIMSKYSITATPGGTKKKPMLDTSASDTFCTHSNLTIPVLSKTVSIIMPIMLDGSGMPVSHIINSPAARHPQIIASCRIIMSRFKFDRKNSIFENMI